MLDFNSQKTNVGLHSFLNSNGYIYLSNLEDNYVSSVIYFTDKKNLYKCTGFNLHNGDSFYQTSNPQMIPWSEINEKNYRSYLVTNIKTAKAMLTRCENSIEYWHKNLSYLGDLSGAQEHQKIDFLTVEKASIEKTIALATRILEREIANSSDGSDELSIA